MVGESCDVFAIRLLVVQTKQLQKIAICCANNWYCKQMQYHVRNPNIRYMLIYLLGNSTTRKRRDFCGLRVKSCHLLLLF